MDIQQIIKSIKPYVLEWIAAREAQAAGSVQDTEYVRRDGTRSITGNLAVDAGVTVDGEDISVLGADVDLLTMQIAALNPYEQTGDIAFLKGDDTTNFAASSRGAVATASDTYAGYVAARAIDSDDLTQWCAVHNIGSWIYVDLLEPFIISRWRILKDNLVLYKIQWSDDHVTWHDLFSMSVYDVDQGGTFSTPVTARYFRLLCTASLDTFYGCTVSSFELYGPAGLRQLAPLHISPNIGWAVGTMPDGSLGYIGEMTPVDHATEHVTGGDIIPNAVAGGNSGLMTGADKTKLDGIAAGAEVNVNADWNAASGDAQILNKPATMPPDAHNQAATTIDVADAGGQYTGEQVEAILAEIATSWAKLTRANTFTLPQTIAGSTNEAELVVKLSSGQTANGFELRTSAGVLLARFDAAGNLEATGLNISPTSYRNFQVLEIPYTANNVDTWYYLGTLPFASISAGIYLDLYAYCTERANGTGYLGGGVHLTANGLYSTPAVSFSHEFYGQISDTHSNSGHFVVMLEGTDYKLYYCAPRYVKTTIVGSANVELVATLVTSGTTIYIPAGTPVYSTMRRATTRRSMGNTTVKSLTLFDEANLGADVMVNGNFADTSIWTATNCTFTVASNQATMTKTAGATAVSLRQLLKTVPGKRYLVQATFKGSLSSGFSNSGALSPAIRAGTTVAGTEYVSCYADTVNGDVILYGDFVATTATTYFNLYYNAVAGDSNIAVFENAFCKEILPGVINDGVALTSDVYGTTYGAGRDASVLYDGTNLEIRPKEVGTGYAHVDGDLVVEDLSDLGTEMLTNGNFADVAGWTLATGTTLSVASNVGSMEETAATVEYPKIIQALTTKIGHKYRFVARFLGTQSSNLSGTLPHLRAGTTSGGQENGIMYATTSYSIDQTLVLDFIATATTTYVSINHRSTTGVSGISKWSSASCKEVVGGDVLVRGTTTLTGDNYFGGFTNAVKVTKDGEMTLIGTATRFLDERGYLQGSRLYSPSSKIVWDDSECAFYFKDTAPATEWLSVSVQFNHDRKHGAVLIPHLHWEQRSSSIPNWMIQYRYQKQGAAKVTAWTSAKYASHAFTYSSGTLDQITSFPAITPTSGDGVSDILQIRIIRDYNNTSTLFTGNDPQAGDVYVTDFDVHKEIDSMGSSSEYVK